MTTGHASPATSPSRRRRLIDVYRGRDLPRTVRALGLASFSQDVASEMVYPLLPVYLVRLGGGAALLGAMESAAEGVLALVKGAAGRWSDRAGVRRPFVAAGYGLSALTRPLLALTVASWQVVGLRMFDRVAKGIRTAPRDAMIAEATPAAQHAYAFSYHRGLDHLGAAVGPLFAAGLLWLAPGELRLVFALATIPAVVGPLVVLLATRDLVRREDATATSSAPPAGDPDTTPRHGGPGDDHPGGRLASRPDDPRGDRSSHAPRSALPRQLRLPLAAFALFALGKTSDAFLLLRASELGWGPVGLALLWALFHVAKWLAAVPGGLLADRLGRRRAVLCGWAVYAGVYAAFAAGASGPWLLLVFLAYATFYGLTEGAEKALVLELAAGAPRQTGTLLGAFHLASGLGGFLASLLFGLVWHLAGAGPAFILGALWAALAATLLLAHQTAGTPTGAAS